MKDCVQSYHKITMKDCVQSYHKITMTNCVQSYHKITMKNCSIISQNNNERLFNHITK